ncbi:hypothetical protein J3E71DRAFT_203651 [Bipolaris maydis]|nr:hypothetical protein J3E71DRAFT_203651 [Bipolaris maydis]
MVNQHLTNGKPMLNKLGKSMSSLLGNSKPTVHVVQSAQSYQSHHGQQGQGQGQGQVAAATATSPQPQQQQQQWGQGHRPSPPPPPPASSPYQQSSYFTSTPGHSGHGHYSPQQTQQAPVSQSYTPPPSATALGYAQQHGHGHGQVGHSPYAPAVQELPGSYGVQESGIIAGTPNHVGGMPNHAANTPPHMAVQSPQAQWGSSIPATQDVPRPQQQPVYALHHVTCPVSPVSPEQQQHWNGMSAAPKPYSPVHAQAPHQPTSPSPTQQGNTVPPLPGHDQAASHFAPPAFAVELPADLGNLSLGSAERAKDNGGRPSLRASEVAQAGTWRLADPGTERATDEFYVLADLLFDALDRQFEPRNTGLVEGSKLMGSCLLRLNEDEKRLFAHHSYGAFAKMWSIEGIPHVMVPCESALTPIWNFDRVAHGQHVRVGESSRGSQARYMPALNRAGWYQFVLVEAMRAPEEFGKAVAAVCADRQPAGLVGKLDLNKLDRTVDPAVRARAGELRAYAIAQACDETRLAVERDGDGNQ